MAYLVVLAVAVWEVVLEVGGPAEGQEGDREEGRGVDLVEVPGAEDEELDLSFLRASQEASRTEARLVAVQEAVQTEVQEVSLGDLEVGLMVEGQSWVVLADVEVAVR